MFSQISGNIIRERWYHRFIKIFMAGTSVLIFAGAFIVLMPQTYQHHYAYSFQASFNSFSGEILTCVAHEKSKSIDCGNLDPKNFISLYLQEKGHYPAAGGTNIRDAVTAYQEKGLSDSQIAMAIIEQNPIQYKKRKELDKKMLLRAGLLSAGLAVVYGLLNLLLYKTTLYIIYGHTKVSRCVDAQFPYSNNRLPPI